MTEATQRSPKSDPANPITDTLQQAGITQREFAELIGVSRVTVNRWLAGASQPSPAIQRVLSRVMLVLGAAVSEGKLPAAIPAAHSKTVVERWTVISRIYNQVEETIPRLSEG